MGRRALNVSESLRKEPGVAGAVMKVRQVLRDDVRTGAAEARWKSEEAAREEEAERKAEKIAAREKWRAEMEAERINTEAPPAKKKAKK